MFTGEGSMFYYNCSGSLRDTGQLDVMYTLYVKVNP